MRKLALALIVAASTALLLTPTFATAQARYRWDARYYTPYAYGPTYSYYQSRGWYARPWSAYPVPYYTYRYSVTPNPYAYSSYYVNPYLSARAYYSPYSNYYVPRYNWTPGSSVYVPY